MTTDEVLALAALALFLAVSLWLGLTRGTPRGQGDWVTARPSPVALLDRTTFTRIPLLTPDQRQLYALIDAHLSHRGDGHRALPQAAVAALLQPVPSGRPARDTAARAALAARRLDIAILDPQGHLAAAIALAPPDDITRMALNRAAVPLLFASPGDRDLAARLDTLLDNDAGPQTC
jgi:hypothetical protein